MSATQTATNLLAALEAATKAAGALLGRPLVEDCTDATTGEIAPLVIWR